MKRLGCLRRNHSGPLEHGAVGYAIIEVRHYFVWGTYLAAQTTLLQAWKFLKNFLIYV